MVHQIQSTVSTLKWVTSYYYLSFLVGATVRWEEFRIFINLTFSSFTAITSTGTSARTWQTVNVIRTRSICTRRGDSTSGFKKKGCYADTVRISDNNGSVFHM